jgi:Tfp pilus assembly protein PilO
MKKYKELIIGYLKQYEIIIISCVVMLAVILLSLNYLVPNIQKVSEISSQYKDLQSKVNSLKAKDDALSALDQKYYKDNFPKIGLVLPDNKDYVSLFNTFDSLENKTGISITNTNLQFGIVSTGSAKLVKPVNGQAQDIPISLTIVGDISSVRKFLNEIRNLTGRLITLEKLDWNYKGGDIIEMSLNGKAFYSSYPSTLGSVSSPLPKINTKQEEILTKISKNTIVPDDVINVNSINVGKKNLFR